MTPSEAVRALLNLLTAKSIPHMVTGGLVANAFGIVRSTQDADIVVQVEDRAFSDFVRALPSELQIDPQISFETIVGTRRQVVRVPGTHFSIELFYLGPDPHDQERFARRIRQFLPDLNCEAWISTAEDMIIQKLRWNRDKDRDDIRNILAVQGEALDFPYIEHWCALHGTQARLEELRRSIPPL